MALRFLMLLLLFMPAIVFAQKKYRHVYDVRFEGQLSDYRVEDRDTVLGAGKCSLMFSFKKKDGTPINEFVWVDIKGSAMDTTVHQVWGAFAITLPADTFSISIHHPDSTPLKVNKILGQENTKAFLRCFLGDKKTPAYGWIHSNKRLTPEELEVIKDDLVNRTYNSFAFQNRKKDWYVVGF